MHNNDDLENPTTKGPWEFRPLGLGIGDLNLYYVFIEKGAPKPA
jgi:hypothetical protein